MLAAVHYNSETRYQYLTAKQRNLLGLSFKLGKVMNVLNQMAFEP
jgi:hypothetical protein